MGINTEDDPGFAETEDMPPKPIPGGLAPFVLPSDNLSPSKMDDDKYSESGKYLTNKPKNSLSIAEYMKRKKTKPKDTLGGDKSDMPTENEESPPEDSNDNQKLFPEYDSNSMPSIK